MTNLYLTFLQTTFGNIIPESETYHLLPFTIKLDIDRYVSQLLKSNEPYKQSKVPDLNVYVQVIQVLPTVSPSQKLLLRELHTSFDLPRNAHLLPIFKNGGIRFQESWTNCINIQRHTKE